MIKVVVVGYSLRTKHRQFPDLQFHKSVRLERVTIKAESKRRRQNKFQSLEESRKFVEQGLLEKEPIVIQVSIQVFHQQKVM